MIEDPYSMIKAVIINSQSTLLKYAVLDVISEFEEREVVPMYEILDRLTQVATYGHYHPPEDWGEEDPEEIMRKFQEQINNIPEVEERAYPGFEDWERRINGVASDNEDGDLDDKLF